MITFDWEAIYLTCFGIGLVLSLLAFFSGFGHLHIGHLRLHTGHHAAGHHGGSLKGGGAKGPHTSPLNGFTVVAFLCWFGGTGYLLHHGSLFSNALVLLLSMLSGLAGAAVVFWFLSRVLLAKEKTLEAADTDIVGVVGKLSGGISNNGVGEMLYSQNGSRWSAVVRSEDGSAIERGAEVIVMRRAKGVAYVRRWDEFEHGLLEGEAAGQAEE
ncbi:MAG TPA: NfeD family protein [Candidatus Aquilonibacter sp.]|nr:NfeD family protein [Candidatus Aquilonibacter sp.]